MDLLRFKCGPFNLAGVNSLGIGLSSANPLFFDARKKNKSPNFDEITKKYTALKKLIKKDKKFKIINLLLDKDLQLFRQIVLACNEYNALVLNCRDLANKMSLLDDIYDQKPRVKKSFFSTLFRKKIEPNSHIIDRSWKNDPNIKSCALFLSKELMNLKIFFTVKVYNILLELSKNHAEVVNFVFEINEDYLDYIFTSCILSKEEAIYEIKNIEKIQNTLLKLKESLD